MEQYYLRLSKVTGLLIFAQRSTRTYQGTKDELKEVYQKVLTHNLLAGWWGLIAFVWNLMALTRNAKAMKKLNSL